MNASDPNYEKIQLRRKSFLGSQIILFVAFVCMKHLLLVDSSKSRDSPDPEYPPEKWYSNPYISYGAEKRLRLRDIPFISKWRLWNATHSNIRNMPFIFFEQPGARFELFLWTQRTSEAFPIYISCAAHKFETVTELSAGHRVGIRMAPRRSAKKETAQQQLIRLAVCLAHRLPAQIVFPCRPAA